MQSERSNERITERDLAWRKLTSVPQMPQAAHRWVVGGKPTERGSSAIDSNRSGSAFLISTPRMPLGEEIGVDWASAPFDEEQFRAGMDVELEHGRRDPRTDVTDDDPVMTAKIALAHLNEFPDYCTRLGRMEEEAQRDHASG